MKIRVDNGKGKGYNIMCRVHYTHNGGGEPVVDTVHCATSHYGSAGMCKAQLERGADMAYKRKKRAAAPTAS